MKTVLAIMLASCLMACGSPEPTAFPVEMPGNDAAMAPRLSELASGKLLLSWIEPGETEGEGDELKFSRYDGLEWSSPQTAASGSNWFNNWADTAGVTALKNGLLVAHWLQKNGNGTYAYEVRYRVSSDGGDTWSESRRAHDDGSASEHGFVSVLPRGDGFELFWLDGRKSQQERGGMTLRMGRFAANGERLMEREIDELVCDCCPTDAVRDGSDSLVVYRDRDAEERRDIFMARVTEDGAITRREVNDDAWHMPACPVNGPAVVSRAGAIHVLWFTAADGKREIRYAIAADGKNFTPATTLAQGDAQGRVELVEVDGDLVALWLAGKGSEGRIQLATLQGGEISATQTIDGMTVSRRVGYPQLGAVRGGDLLVTWIGEAGLEGRRIQR